MRAFYKLPLCCLCMLLLNCCAPNEDIIPDTSFTAIIKNFTADPRYRDNPQSILYDSYGNRIGISGVAVYKVGTEIVYAFDLMCPNEKSIASTVTKNSDGTYECPTCGSIFTVYTEYSSVIEGPSKYGLKSYRAELSGSDLLIAN